MRRIVKDALILGHESIIEQCNFKTNSPSTVSFFGWSASFWEQEEKNDDFRVAIFKVKLKFKKQVVNVSEDNLPF